MSAMVEDILGKTVILIAAAGDASRFILPHLHDRLYEHGLHSAAIPLWMRRYCFATWQLPQTGLSVLGSHLTFIRNRLDISFPVAVITGPNTNDAIVAHMGENNQFGLNNVTVIEQDSSSAFIPDGQLLFWEDGNDFRAPNGTAGCVRALLGSMWLQKQIYEGREYVYMWYVNDLTAGQHITKHLAYSASGRSHINWLSGPQGIELVEKVVKTDSPEDRMQLIYTLEDSSGAYIFHHQVEKTLVNSADPHVVERKLPVVLHNGSFLRGYKRELFLCDPVWKQQNESTAYNSGTTTYTVSASKDPTRKLPPTRAEQFFTGVSKEQVLQALVSHSAIEVPRYLGQKEVGENLVDDWRIDTVIEEGGMSTVYLCRSAIGEERIAVKSYKHNDRWCKPGVRAQFRKEGLVWVALAPHPHLIEALSVREIDGALHIFMEYATGGSLTDRIKQGPLPMLTAIQIGIHVCDALQTIHAQGFLHKDVKPANVLFDERGYAKLSDLGLAAAFYGSDITELAGTLPYMAPEFHSHGSIGNTADIYSLGVTLYETLTAVLLFQGTKSEIVHQHLSAPPVPLVDRIPDLDAELDEIVMSCLAKKSQDRPQSAAEVAERLKLCYRRLAGHSYESVGLLCDDARNAIQVSRKRVWAYQALGQEKDAMEVCEKLFQAFPENKTIALDQAVLYYDNNRFSDCARICLNLLSQLAASEPDMLARADSWLEMCAIQLGKREDVVEAYTKWLHLAITGAVINGDDQRSIKILELCIKIDPECSPAWILKGQLLYERGNFSEAVKALREGLRTLWDFSAQGQAINALETLDKCEKLLHPEIGEDIEAVELAMSHGDPAAVEQAAHQVITCVPDSIWAMDILGTALEQQQRYDEAITCFEIVLESAPAHAHAHFTKGLAMLRSGKDLKATLTEFEFSVALNPNDYKAINMVGECYRLIGETSKAIETFKKSLEINPQSIVALMAVSTALVHSGQEDSAIYFANQAVQCYPSDPEAWEIQGDVLAAAGHREEARNSWEKALLIGGITPRLFEKMSGRFQEKTKQESKSQQRQDLQTDLEDTGISSKAESCYNSGVKCYAQRKYQEALADYNRAIDLGQNDARIYTNRGMTYNKLGELKEALVDYNRAIQLDPIHTLAYYNRGNIYFALGRYEESLVDYTRAIQLDPILVLAYNNRGNTYGMLNRREDALADYAHALQIDPSLALTYLNIGVLHANANQLQQALHYFEKAAALGDPTAAQSAVRVRRMIGGGKKGFLSKLFGKK